MRLPARTGGGAGASFFDRGNEDMDVDLRINEAFEQHYKLLFRYCLSNLEGDEQAAMDAVDTVFTIARAKAESLDAVTDIKRWLLVTAKNTVKNIKRKQRRYSRRFILFDPADLNAKSFSKNTRLTWWEKRVLSSWTAEDAGFDGGELSDKELAELKTRFLDTLSPEERELFCSRYEQGISTAELAVRYGRTQDAVRLRLSRISIKLTERIRAYFGSGAGSNDGGAK